MRYELSHDEWSVIRPMLPNSHVEQVVLEALKTQLMAPDLLKAFIEGFHEELNRKSAADDQRRLGSEQEFAQVTRKLKGLYQAIADGLRSLGLQKGPLALEARQSELETTMAVIPPPAAPSTQGWPISIGSGSESCMWP